MATPEEANTVCAECGARFRCGMTGGDTACWCASLPMPAGLADASLSAQCLCPDCLRARIAANAAAPG